MLNQTAVIYALTLCITKIIIGFFQEEQNWVSFFAMFSIGNVFVYFFTCLINRLTIFQNAINSDKILQILFLPSHFYKFL